MSQPHRMLHGAPGGVLHGHPTSDESRRELSAAVLKIARHANRTVDFLPPLLEEVTASLVEVERMREEMGEGRMEPDGRRQVLARAAAHAAWLMQRESAFLSSVFSPTDPEAEFFAPAASLAANTSWLQRRVTRLDKLRQAYLVHAHLPDATARADALGAASIRLFRAITGAMGTGQEPVPLAEARQRWDRAYATLRDTVQGMRVLIPEHAVECFPDLSPVWRMQDLARD